MKITFFLHIFKDCFPQTNAHLTIYSRIQYSTVVKHLFLYFQNGSYFQAAIISVLYSFTYSNETKHFELSKLADPYVQEIFV